MLATIIKTVFGSRNDRLIKAYSRIVSQISALEPTIVTLSDEELKEKTSFFKSEIENKRWRHCGLRPVRGVADLWKTKT